MSELTFGYTSAPLFEDLSFNVAAGELLHIKGPNGSGKSTLLAIVAGLLQAERGKITLREATTEYLPAEGNGHYLKLDARENLRFWMQLHGKHLTDQQLLDELKFWRLNPGIVFNKIPVEQFSTGMKRKLALARVRLSGTNLWYLDEPVSGLDDHALVQFKLMLQSHVRTGGAALVISHDTGPIKELVTQTLTIGP